MVEFYLKEFCHQQIPVYPIVRFLKIHKEGVKLGLGSFRELVIFVGLDDVRDLHPTNGVCLGVTTWRMSPCLCDSIVDNCPQHHLRLSTHLALPYQKVSALREGDSWYRAVYHLSVKMELYIERFLHRLNLPPITSRPFYKLYRNIISVA